MTGRYRRQINDRNLMCARLACAEPRRRLPPSRRALPAPHRALTAPTAPLPAGAARITYQITVLRSTRTGQPAQFIVNIGGAAADANFIQVARAA